MPVIDLTEVKGVHDEDGVHCTKCLDEQTPGWERKTDPSNFLMEEDIENPEKLYICDACKEPL